MTSYSVIYCGSQASDTSLCFCYPGVNMFLVAVLIATLLLAGTNCQQSEQQLALRSIVQSNNDFSKELYKVVSSGHGNLVMSALSAEAVLAMAWVGTGGNTAQQLATGLRLPSNRDHVLNGFSALFSTLNNAGNITLDIANRLYIQNSAEIKDSFQHSVAQNFHSDAVRLDFTNEEASKTAINQWVEERTHNRIKNLVDSIDRTTLMMIINAVYFKGNWKQKFEESSTEARPFHLSTDSTVNVPTMYQSADFKYADIPQLDIKVLKLNYADEAFSMMILLPNEIGGLANLEAKISSVNLEEVSSKLFEYEVEVFLPKFKIEKEIPLNDALIQLGMDEIFRPGANFSGITDDNVYVSKVLQKAFIEVNEEGTEAAAATSVQIAVYSTVTKRASVYRADHPFLYLLMDNRSGAILFMGRVVDPRQS